MDSVSERERTAEARALDVTVLLHIDVEEELEKVLGGQLLGGWQLPAELVRLAARRASTRVEVQLAGDTVRVTWDGPAPSADALAGLGQLLGPVVPAPARHLALLRVEAEGDPALLILAALRPRQLAIEPRGGQGGLHLRAGLVPRTAVPAVAVRHSTITVQLAFDGARARDHLRAAARFARLEVLLNGRRIGSQGHRGLAEVDFDGGLPGQLWLTERGDGARYYLLVDQVVAAELATAATPPFEACLELRPTLGNAWSAASLRQIAEQHAPGVMERAFALLLRLGHDMEVLNAASQQRVRRALLLATRERGEVGPLIGLPLWRTLVRGQAQARWRTLGELMDRLPRIHALYPGQRPEDFLLPAEEAVVVDADERALLTRLLGLRFVAPQPRLGAARGLHARLGAGFHALWTTLRSPLRGRPVAETALSADERRFLAVLRERLRDHVSDVQLTTGRGRIERRGGARSQLLLPRANSDVVRCRKALLADPAWLYPVALVLLGASAPSIEARLAWSRRRWEP